MHYVQSGDCAWFDCKVHDCLYRMDENCKLKSLPSCESHKKFFREFRSLYKKMGELYIEDDISSLSDCNKIQILTVNCKVLTTEIEHRLEFTKLIKAKYRNQEHSFYIQSLIDHVNNSLNLIDLLQKENRDKMRFDD